MNEREFRDQEKAGRHPPACTCSDCNRRRLQRVQGSGNPLKKLIDFIFRR